MPILTANGARIAYTDTGPPPARPDAPTVIFGHGLLFSGWMFHHQVQALRERYRCVTVDWRGQGDTPATPDGYDMDTLTADAVGVIRALGVAPVHWVGLSMGGFVGMRLAARHGEVLRSLALLDTSAGPEDPDKISRYRLLALAYRLVGIRPIRGQVEPIMFGPTLRADPAGRAVIDEWATRLSRCDRAGMRRAILGVCDRAPIEGELDAITVPTLVAVGDDDVATPPAKARRIVEAIPDATLSGIPHSGHSCAIEQPDTVTTLLGDFLDRHS
jgi:pimeloyl-ACP methyl ester carboxylesterase